MSRTVGWIAVSPSPFVQPHDFPAGPRPAAMVIHLALQQPAKESLGGSYIPTARDRDVDYVAGSLQTTLVLLRLPGTAAATIVLVAELCLVAVAADRRNVPALALVALATWPGPVGGGDWVRRGGGRGPRAVCGRPGRLAA